MADEDDPMVTISGPALAMLLYENTRTIDQIGFLLGEVLVYVTKKVTDSDRDVEQTQFHINIKSLVAYPTGEPFFDTVGILNESKLQKFLGDNSKKVVGWYHYRDELPLKLTLRDHNLHAGLSKFFPQFNKYLLEEMFLFCLLNSTQSEIGGTHKFKQLLMRKKSFADFSAVSLKINNLGADATRPDGSDYKLTPKYSSCEKDLFDEVYKSLREDLKNAGSNVQTVKMIQHGAENFLNEIIKKVESTDKKVSQLEQRLEMLRQQKFHKACENRVLEIQMRQMEVDTNKCDTRSDSLTPDILPQPQSPLIFEDSPKRHIPSGSNSRSGTPKNLNQSYNSIERKRGSHSPDRDYRNYSLGQTSTLSNQLSKGSSNDRLIDVAGSSRGGSSPSTLDRKSSRCSKQYTESPSYTTSRSAQHRKSLQQSSDHESNDSL